MRRYKFAGTNVEVNDSEGFIENTMLRMGALTAIRDFRGDGRDDIPASEELARLLGYDSYQSLALFSVERDNNIMRLLAGENGYVVYKMMLAKEKAS
jgi:hypothetical protein